MIGDTCRLPVEPCRTVDAVETRAADGDVVAALAVETVIARLTEENVVPRTLQFVQEERAATVAAEAVALVAALQPVVAAIALHRVAAQPGHDEVVARAGEGLIGVRSTVGEVAAVAAEHDVQARARTDHVVARTTRRDVVAIAVGDEVAALAAQRHIGAGPTFDDIVAQPTPEGVAVVAARRTVGVVGAVVHRLAIDSRRIDAVGELVLDGAIGKASQQGVLVALGGRVIGDHRTRGREPCRRAVQVGQLELAVGRRERVGLQRMGGGVAHEQLGEAVALERAEQVRARSALEVVEPVCVLQIGHLVLEHEVERAAQHAAEGHSGLGQATDPQVDVVDTGLRCRADVGPRAGAEHEVRGIGGNHRIADHRIDDALCGQAS